MPFSNSFPFGPRGGGLINPFNRKPPPERKLTDAELYGDTINKHRGNAVIAGMILLVLVGAVVAILVLH